MVDTAIKHGVPKGFRTWAPICLAAALIRLCSGRLRISRRDLGGDLITDEGPFRPFRQIVDTGAVPTEDSCVFSVRFRFARLTEMQNRRASIMPMLIIAGTPGFCGKTYASHPGSGRWMGLYEWASPAHLEAYRRSWVYRMMNRRAAAGSLVETRHDAAVPVSPA